MVTCGDAGARVYVRCVQAAKNRKSNIVRRVRSVVARSPFPNDFQTAAGGHR